MSLKQKTTGFFAEFRKFIARGNVMDLAVGVIIGAAFKSIADSLANDLLMPLLGLLTPSGLSLSTLTLGPVKIGSFLDTVLSFLITAFALFCVVKAINTIHRKKEQAPSAPPKPSEEVLLLTEIRDLLKEKNG